MRRMNTGVSTVALAIAQTRRGIKQMMLKSMGISLIELEHVKDQEGSSTANCSAGSDDAEKNFLELAGGHGYSSKMKLWT